MTRTVGELRRAGIIQGRAGELRVVDPVRMMPIIRVVTTQAA